MKAFPAGEIAKSNNTAQCLELAAERKVKNYVRLWTLEMGGGGLRVRGILIVAFSRQVVHSLLKALFDHDLLMTGF